MPPMHQEPICSKQWLGRPHPWSRPWSSSLLQIGLTKFLLHLIPSATPSFSDNTTTRKTTAFLEAYTRHRPMPPQRPLKY
jgi:hypothetical protein